MANLINKEVNEEIKKINKDFFSKLNSKMHYKSKMQGDSITFDWLDILEDACPYIDNVVRVPKLILINKEEVEIIEKSKKINSDSVKDLVRHSYYIDEYNPNENNVRPNKILNISSEETFNIYENRFLYTVIFFFTRFVLKKEKELDDLIIDRTRKMEYSGITRVGQENVSIELKINATDVSNAGVDKNLLEQIKDAKRRISKMRDYISGWQRSELIKSLEKDRVKLINPPIKKTNIILKNPNFQVAVNLWNFLYNYDETEGNKQNGLDTDGNDLLMGLLDHSFLLDFYVMDSVCKTKKDQKEKLNEFAFGLINEEIRRLIDLLKKCGFNITDEQILELIAANMTDSNEVTDKAKLARDDIKNKFQDAMGSYLERVQEYL